MTDLEPGQYELSVQINDERILPELSYDNNDHTVPVTVTDGNISAECPPGARTGTRRSCGWTMGETERCRAGDLIEIGCGGCNELGAPCEGDPMLRVCEGEGVQCLPSTALAQNNNGCGETKCPHVEFMCPESRVFTVWTAQNDIEEPATCVPTVRAGPLRLPALVASGHLRGWKEPVAGRSLWTMWNVAQACHIGLDAVLEKRHVMLEGVVSVTR